MPHIALATCHQFSNLYQGEAPLLAALEKRGIRYTPAVWNSPEIAWESYDAVIIRNTWDYHQQAPVFSAWLDYLESKQIRIFNPVPLLRWNMNKIYLQQLEACGIRILPTVFATQEAINLGETLAANSWGEAIAKPLISASGNNTWKINLQNAHEYQYQFDFIQTRIGAMIQPYAPQIAEVGEYSFIFFNGEFHHAVLKKPAPNSLFVHEEHGGSNHISKPNPEVITQAQAALKTVQQLTGVLPLYARVDGFMDGESFVLMELECIEPELYLPYGDGAGDHFAEAIHGILS